MEQWKWIPGYVLRYAVSDQGRVFSFIQHEWKYLALSKNGQSGHLTVQLGKGNKRYVHELVLTTFVGPCPPGMEARHLKGKPNDNHLSSLEWNTRSINTIDRKGHDGGGGSHLLLSEVVSIKQSLARGVKRKALAEKYGVAYSTIQKIDIGITHTEVLVWPNL